MVFVAGFLLTHTVASESARKTGPRMDCEPPSTANKDDRRRSTRTTFRPWFLKCGTRARHLPLIIRQLDHITCSDSGTASTFMYRAGRGGGGLSPLVKDAPEDLVNLGENGSFLSFSCQGPVMNWLKVGTPTQFSTWLGLLHLRGQSNEQRAAVLPPPHPACPAQGCMGIPETPMDGGEV